MEIAFFRQEQLESVVDLLHDMSVHYNRDNASSRDVVKANLIDSILGPDSGVRLVIASETSRAVGLAAISLLYPAPKERGQLFMKELYVVSDKRGAGVGRALMRWTAKYAVAKNCSRLDWTVDDTNPEGKNAACFSVNSRSRRAIIRPLIGREVRQWNSPPCFKK